MHDVHDLVTTGMIAALFTTLYLVLYAQWKPITRILCKDTFIMSMVLVLFLIPFDYTFTWFHQAFFSGNWQFPADSWLITHFSSDFFLAAAITWIISTTALLAALTRAVPEQVF